MKTHKEIESLIVALKQAYPDALCELEYTEDYQLLFAARLSAQCTDARVNKVTPALFGRFPTLRAIAGADIGEVEGIIHSCGFFRSKARDIVMCANVLLERYDSRIPDTMEELCALPGVGRKTANLILGDVHKKPAVVVDTHCIRITNRLGIVDVKDPYKIELRLKELLPENEQSDFCHRIVLHGRAVCNAKKPMCGVCTVSGLCDYYVNLNSSPPLRGRS